MGSVLFTGVAADDIPIVHERVRPMIEKSIKRSGLSHKWTADALLAACMIKEKQCWVAMIDGWIVAAMVSSIKIFPTGFKVFFIEHLGGASFAKWSGEAIKIVTEFAKELGCDSIECEGRKGWGRLCAFESSRVTVHQLNLR